MLHVNKKVEGNMTMMKSEIDNIKKTQIKFQEMKKTISKIKNKLDVINIWLDIAEENDRTIKTIKNEVQREKILKEKWTEH